MVSCVQVHPYPCIRGFGFAKLKIARIPAYPRVLDLAKSRPGAIFLDIGCCSEDEQILGTRLVNSSMPISPRYSGRSSEEDYLRWVADVAYNRDGPQTRYGPGVFPTLGG